MKYLFLYCPETAINDTVNYFSGKGYSTAPLNDDPRTFWDWVTAVDNGGILVILSHGDANGPLMVKGHNGRDMSKKEIEEFGAILVQKNVSLYLLSCLSGSGAFAKSLAATGATFIAPEGNAEVEANSLRMTVYSRSDDHKPSGWFSNGIAAPSRNSKPLVIPSGD